MNTAESVNDQIIRRSLEAIDRAQPSTTSKIKSFIQRQATPHNMMLLTIGGGFAVVLREVDRQRKIVAKVKETNETLVHFIATLAEETTCGEEAFIYLQVKAEEEEGESVAQWSEEDEMPIPYTLISEEHSDVE